MSPQMSWSVGSLSCEAACPTARIHIKKRFAATATVDKASTQASCSTRLVRTTSVTHRSKVNNHVSMFHRAWLRKTRLLGFGSKQGPTENSPMQCMSARAVVAASCSRVASHMVSRPAHFAAASVLWRAGSFFFCLLHATFRRHGSYRCRLPGSGFPRSCR